MVNSRERVSSSVTGNNLRNYQSSLGEKVPTASSSTFSGSAKPL